MVVLHNEADKDEVYGSKLYGQCKEFEMQGRVEQGFGEKVFFLSVDYPMDLVMELPYPGLGFN